MRMVWVDAKGRSWTVAIGAKDIRFSNEHGIFAWRTPGPVGPWAWIIIKQLMIEMNNS
jgi:hypothetical protein